MVNKTGGVILPRRNMEGEMPEEGNQGAGNGDQGAGTGDQGTGAENPTFESFYGGLDEAARGLVDGHISGLKNALQSERQQRGELAKQIKDLAGKSEKGSELEKQLTEASAKLELAERRATFFEDAAKPEIGCTNARLAFVLAQAEELFDKRGAPDWNAIKAAAPELFRRVGAGSADGGAGSRPKADRRRVGKNYELGITTSTSGS